MDSEQIELITNSCLVYLDVHQLVADKFPSHLTKGFGIFLWRGGLHAPQAWLELLQLINTLNIALFGWYVRQC